MKRLLKIALAAFLACVCALSLIACDLSGDGGSGGLKDNGGYEDEDKNNSGGAAEDNDNAGGNAGNQTSGNTGGSSGENPGDQTGDEKPDAIDKNLTFPVVSVNFTGGAPTKKDDGYMPCSVSTAGDDSAELISNADAKIKIRGNSTAEGEKKPYRIKFTSKQPMLGLNDGNKFKSWVLLADCFDYSMSRNYFILQASKIFTNVYSSDCRYVNLYFDGKYQGVYLLAEQTQVNKNRVNVDEKSVETSANTGYLLEADTRALTECVLFDKTGEAKTYYEKNGTGDVTVKTIEQMATADDYIAGKDYCFDVTYDYSTSKGSVTAHQLFAVKNDLSLDKQIAFLQLEKIQAYMQSCYDVIFGADVTQAEFEKYIDIKSAADMFIINNLASLRGGKRSDFYSVDFTKDNPKLNFGPPWDYDLDCANYNLKPAANGGNKENFFGDNPKAFSASYNPSYVLGALYRKSYIVSAVKTRWKETRAYENLKELINSLDPDNTFSIPNEHEYDFNKNYSVYKFFGKKTYAYQSDAVLSFTSHKDAVAYFVSWMNEHLTFANNYYN